jgi:glycosyltransferase involved in cell wall biosynthesis
VILCYRAGQRVRTFVGEVISELDRLTTNWEIILVGNYLKGIPDETPQIVRDIASKDDRIKSVTLEKHGMMGWDARSGLVRATGDTIALIDGDGQMLPEDLPKVYTKLKEEDLDLVKTYRQQRYDGFWRKANSRVYNMVFRLLFPGSGIRDVNSKPKIFSRTFLNRLHLQSNDWFLDAEIMIQGRRYKGRIGEIPTVFFESKGRRSFIRPGHILEFLKNLLLARIKEFFVSE